MSKRKTKHAIEEAFDAIRVERQYQDRLWGDSLYEGRHSVSEWILYIRNYLQEAEDVVCRKAAPKCDEDALHIIRKVVAMGVCCMEQNGVLWRNMKDLERSCELHGVKCEEGEDA
jgi:hypothetical protein